MLVQQEEISVSRLKLVSAPPEHIQVSGSRAPTLAEGEVSSYPLKLIQSTTVTTPSSLNPSGSSWRICRASVAGNAEPLESVRYQTKRKLATHLDSMMILSGAYLSLISIKAFSTRPTIVQHLL